ncbi:MAG: DNA polymerase IV [Caulobacteraceae bacterium]
MSWLCRDCLEMGEGAPRRCPVCASARLVSHAELAELAIAHVDCDAFYASVEKRDRPELADQPVIVGGGVRGVVTTCCYIARTFGVRSAMPMFEARRLCPQAVVIRPDFAKYRAESSRIMALLGALTPLVSPLSLDEAWLDLSGTARLHGAAPAAVLARAQGRIETEIGLIVSVGLAPNRFLAKIASDRDKPRGFCVVGRGDAKAFLAPLPVAALPGVGPALASRLHAAGFGLVGDLQAAGEAETSRRLRPQGIDGLGARLCDLAAGRGSGTVDPGPRRRTISAETTFEEDLSGLADLETALFALCEKLARRARAAGAAGRVVSLKLRDSRFRVLSRRRTLTGPIQTARSLFEEARRLLRRETGEGPWRLIGVGLSDLEARSDPAFGFFDERETRALAAESAGDALRARFGDGALSAARMLSLPPPRRPGDRERAARPSKGLPKM